MNFNFAKNFVQNARDLFLLALFFVLVFLSGFILWKNYLKPSLEVSPPQIPFLKKEIQVNFSVFDHEVFKLLEEMPQILPPAKEEIGKENPFLP